MEKLFKSKPIFSFILITFLFTFIIWFIPVVISVPKDIKYALVLLGTCGPLIAGYVITVINSKARFRIHSKPIFLSIFILVSAILMLQFYFDSSSSKIRPTLSEVSYLGYILFAIVFFIISMNWSNATNIDLKENYLNEVLFKKEKVKWYIIGFALFTVISLFSYFSGTLLGLETSDYIFKAEPFWIIGFLATLFLTGGNEEFGWRGFLQKELQKKYNPLITSCIIAFFWSLWHLPLYYNGIYSTGGIIDILPRFLLTLPLTFIYTWLYNKSSYALLAVILLHATRNNINIIIGYSAVLGQVMIFLFSFYCIFKDKMWKKRKFDHIYAIEKTNASS